MPAITSTVGSDLFDPQEALNRACDDIELLAELAELFAENRDRLLKQLGDAIAQGNARGIDEAAHALKGSIGTFTTKRPFRTARELEFCGKERRLEAAPHLFASLKADLAELETAVANFLASTR
jgi:HPt (histidine-containing phosphotransfer) domain-containing protein